jgi:hypothetical protein
VQVRVLDFPQQRLVPSDCVRDRLLSVNNGDWYDDPMTDGSARFGSGGIPIKISAQKLFSCAKHLLAMRISWHSVTF